MGTFTFWKSEIFMKRTSKMIQDLRERTKRFNNFPYSYLANVSGKWFSQITRLGKITNLNYRAFAVWRSEAGFSKFIDFLENYYSRAWRLILTFLTFFGLNSRFDMTTLSKASGSRTESNWNWLSRSRTKLAYSPSESELRVRVPVTAVPPEPQQERLYKLFLRVNNIKFLDAKKIGDICRKYFIQYRRKLLWDHLFFHHFLKCLNFYNIKLNIVMP